MSCSPFHRAVYNLINPPRPRGGIILTPVTSGAELARAFLDAMERRDLNTASGFLAEGFCMLFPGGAAFTRLEELVEHSRSRNRWVRKRIERIEESQQGEDTVVYCFGTLYGEWTDGTPFEGIRFIDRFVARGGKLVDQKVWNDMGEPLWRRT